MRWYDTCTPLLEQSIEVVVLAPCTSFHAALSAVSSSCEQFFYSANEMEANDSSSRPKNGRLVHPMKIIEFPC
jgi:hypothetical protein